MTGISWAARVRHGGAEAPAWCHRHLARGQYVPAAATRVPIDLEVLVAAPDLCQQCLDDMDSWLRLFGIREEAC